MVPLKDLSLIKDLKQGKAAAFEQLVLEYQDRVINTCYGFVQNTEDAEDIAQEVFIEVYRSVTKFREDSKIFTWIYQIAVRKSLDFVRKKNRKKRFSSLKRIAGFETIEDKVKSSAFDPQESLENKERRRILMQAVEQLPENQKVAFTLSKYEGLAYKEIAEVMESSLSSVESLLFRANKNLRKKLGSYYRKNKI